MEQETDENPLWKTKPVYPITGELINTKHFDLQMPNDKSMEQETLEIVTVEKASEKELVKVNPLKIQLNELKDKYKDADIKDNSDKDGYELCKVAVAAFRTHKTTTEKKRKEHKFFFLEMGKIIDKNYNDVIEDAEAQQEAFNKKVKDYEAEKDRLRNEKKEAEARLLQERESKLTELNALYSGGTFILGDAYAKRETLGFISEEVFADVLRQFQEAHEKIEAEAAEVERKRQQEAEDLRREQEKLRIQREEMQKEIDRIQLEREKLEKDREAVVKAERDRIEAEEKKARWEKAEAERSENERIERLWRGRLSELLDVVWDGEVAIYNDSEFITMEELISFSVEDFNKVRDIHNKQVVENRADAGRKRKEEEEKQRIETEKEQVGRVRFHALGLLGYVNPSMDLKNMPEEEYLNLYSSITATYEQKKHEEWLENERIKKIQQEEREKERLAELTDGEKWREFKTALAKFAADMPDFPSGRYARMKAIALDKFGEIQAMRREQFKGNK